MEPFSIACTTCQARLRVRDESVIGQILTCPKCGSMVLVEPVAAATDTAHNVSPSAPYDSPPAHAMDLPADASATPAEFEDAARLFDEPGQPPAANRPVPNLPDLTETVEDLSVDAESPHGTSNNDVDFPAASGWKGESAETGDPDDTAASELSPPPRPVAGEVLLPNADWTSASTAKWRNRILTGLAAVVGVVLALMLLIWFSGGDQSAAIGPRPKTPEMASTGDVVPHQPGPLEPEDRAAEAISESDPAAPSPEAGSGNADTDVTPGEAAADGSAVPPIEQPIEVPEPGVPGPAAQPGGEPAATDPGADEPPGLTPKDTTKDPAAAGGEPSPLSDTLREFGAFLDKVEEPAGPTPTAATELPAVPESDESDAEPVVRRPGPRVVELDERLNDPIKGFEFDGGPLASFLRLVSDCSTIPITLDADILRWAKFSPSTPVRLQATDTTVAEILKQGLAPLGLEYRIESDQLFVTRRPREETGRRTATFAVEDLVGDDAEQLQQLGTRIMDFAAPESWSSRGGDGTITFRGTELIIEQRETVQFEILEFCEKLRVARGLDTQYPKYYHPSMFRLESRSERAGPKLAQSITLTYIRPAPLQDIVDRIAETAKLHILIDWRALAEAGWSPDAKVRFSVADQPVAKALATLLEPMDLTYRIIDESTLQVTTPAVLDSRLEIEFYRVPKIAGDGAKLVQLAREALGPANFRDFGGSGQLLFDEPSKCLLACLSQSRQMELQTWLSAQPAAAPQAAAAEAATPTATVGSRIVPASGRASSD